MTEREKMLAGQLYLAHDPELQAMHARARQITFRFNHDPEEDCTELRHLFAQAGEDCSIHAPFRCDYGCHIRVGDHFYANYGCTILDVAPVTIGSHCLLGPNVSLFTAGPPLEAAMRSAGPEYGRPITIGDHVWLGGGVIVCPGVTIGDGAVAAAGAVITRDVPPYTLVGGNPARVIRELKARKRYRAVIFDFDYTLGDATDAIVAGAAHGLTVLGHPAPEREAVRRTVGYHLRDAYTMLTGDEDPARREEFVRLFREAAAEREMRDTPLFPGAMELLGALRRAGIPAGVVSTKSSPVLRGALAGHGADRLLDCVIGGDDVAAIKPDPEGLLAALDRLGAGPEEALYCGDTLIDCETARRAGTDFCAVLNGTTRAEDFANRPYVYIASGLGELQRWLGL